ncbi:MAG: hypothetical protein IPO91_02415 [Chloroflexi bacterium]|nr:hypothetical protein [Chloroflexota bacterium]
MREGYLAWSALLFRHWDSVLDDQRQPPAAFWKELLDYPYPVFLWGSAHWEPGDAERDRRMLRLEIATPPYGYRRGGLAAQSAGCGDAHRRRARDISQ